MADLDRLAAARAAHGQSFYRVLEELSAAVIGHRLFTIMRFDSGRAEVERVYSSNPAAYPVGGRKKKRDTAWADQVLGLKQVFRVTTPQEIQVAFDDHATIFGLGIGSILNIPVADRGR